MSLTMTIEVPVTFPHPGRGNPQERRWGAEAASLPAGRVPRVARLMALALRLEELVRQGQVRQAGAAGPGRTGGRAAPGADRQGRQPAARRLPRRRALSVAVEAGRVADRVIAIRVAGKAMAAVTVIHPGRVAAGSER